MNCQYKILKASVRQNLKSNVRQNPKSNCWTLDKTLKAFVRQNTVLKVTGRQNSNTSLRQNSEINVGQNPKNICLKKY